MDTGFAGLKKKNQKNFQKTLDFAIAKWYIIFNKGTSQKRSKKEGEILGGGKPQTTEYRDPTTPTRGSVARTATRPERTKGMAAPLKGAAGNVGRNKPGLGATR